MQKYIILCAFAAIFTALIRRDRIYVVPMIIIIYSNINGLLGWEDFALKGFIKFQDYGLLLTLAILFFSRFSYQSNNTGIESIARSTWLYNIINIYWFYYIILLVFSVVLMMGVVWPIKMGRVFFYGIIFYLIYRELLSDPIVGYEKIINVLMCATLFFGLCYIAYNILHLEIYPTGAYESFSIGGTSDDVSRNFSGFPTFTFYFIFLLTHRLICGTGRRLINFGGLAILMICVLLMLTRGALILSGLLIVFLMLYRIPSARNLRRLAVLAILIFGVVALTPYVAEGHYLAMVRRFEEFGSTGLTNAGNFNVRMREFLQIFHNVMDFDPFFGFGFTVASAFGYITSQIHGGSADNGYANILGVTGFFGLGIFVMVIIGWLIINIKLQSMKVEEYSKVNFVFILYMLGSLMNGAIMSYMHSYAVFMIYDLLAYSYFKQREIKEDVHLLSNDVLARNLWF